MNVLFTLEKVTTTVVLGYLSISAMVKCINLMVFLSRFSFKDAVDSKESRGKKETNFVCLYHSLPLKNIHTFICCSAI